ncbi:hypothetical protein ACFVFI_37320, partial [Streptomyces sp. NPDC057705]|uniref:hypothetical protein n=1 Tax=Streptomyces sp. NPDC057705 TaxID=3346222 RepID=UPI0036B114D0
SGAGIERGAGRGLPPAGPDTGVPASQRPALPDAGRRAAATALGAPGRGPLARYDKTATTYLAGLHLAALFIWSAR